MDIKFETPIVYLPDAGSPEVDSKREAIRIAVSDVAFEARTARFHMRAAYQFPGEIAGRYHRPEEAMVLVVHDIEQADGGSIRLENTFVWYRPGARPEPNQIAEPPLPMPGRGSLVTTSYRGGWLDVGVAFPCYAQVPRYRPSAYVYLLLENYVSNVIGLDLVDKKAIEL